nr:transglycosylase SLT domain-containing protein [Beijerinckia indica]
MVLMAPMPGRAAANLPIEGPIPSAKPPQASAPTPTGSQTDDRKEGTLPAAAKPYQALILSEARKNGLPPEIADAVVAIESGYDPSVIGGVGEIGLMQVRPETAAMLGFRGSTMELARPEVNLRYGALYLGRAWQLANGDLCRALMKYRAGHGEEIMTPLSQSYCQRAKAHLAARGSPYGTGTAPALLPAFAASRPAIVSHWRPGRIRTAAVSRSFWAAHEARVRAITARIEARWKRLAAR